MKRKSKVIFSEEYKTGLVNEFGHLPSKSEYLTSVISYIDLELKLLEEEWKILPRDKKSRKELSERLILAAKFKKIFTEALNDHKN